MRLFAAVLCSMTAVASTLAIEPPKDSLALKVSLVKESYTEGEPISIRVDVSNQAAQEVRILLDYPTLGGAPNADQPKGLAFHSKRLARRLRETARPMVFDYEVALVPVLPNGSYSVTVALQRFLEPPKAGTYEIGYTLQMGYYIGKPSGAPCLANTQGNLTVTVLPRDEEKLRRVLQQALSDVRRGDSWQRLAAVDALSTTPDPAVIPFLEELYTAGEEPAAVEALGRFPEAATRPAVVRGLNSRKAETVAAALKALVGWKHELDRHQVENLLGSDDPEIRRATIEYIKSIGRKDYLKLISP
jgi:hypothetical protein